jgi:DNA-binding transcriptional LysR family regulator
MAHEGNSSGIMDIDLLKSFIAICETGSFTQAARQVGRTQSAVSLQVRRLEATLGRPLLSRLGGNVQLTDHGELFLGYAKDIVSSYNDALSAFNRGSVEGVVVLGPLSIMRRASSPTSCAASSSSIPWPPSIWCSKNQWCWPRA